VLVWLNGRVVAAGRARVSALDRGLLHGDGVYDTWRTYGGEPFAVAEHIERLAAACRRLRLASPGAAATWVARSRVLVRRNRLPDATVRLTVTRGAAGGSLWPVGKAAPTVLLTVRPLPADLGLHQASGIGAVLLGFPRDSGPPWGATKLVGHPSAVLGRAVAARHGAEEGFYVTSDGTVTEGTTSNLFVVRGGRLITPPLAAGVLPGVTRDRVLALARRARVTVRERAISVAQLAAADEVFVTASTVEVLPVTRLDGRRVGDGRPGPLTRRLQGLYAAWVARRRRLGCIAARGESC
jgi:branched-subunit amino acid aminotransferase/4-amino-4-deoxychorismate lyase